eukprot:TRINITY_DN16531_c0_g1_i1.p1 TRINITY_DN16531_c0_g1~~TRINITY_DN16531_c0_g1_i1.p1  ORF type:complete len:505 (+),score=110.80 TRINITY_DN16531_c0_g1_i1:202-1716(+)
MRAERFLAGDAETPTSDYFLGSTKVDEADQPQDGLVSNISGYLIMMNVIIGSGCLGLPYAFSQGGWLLGICVIGFSTIINSITMGWLLESMARADAIERVAQGPNHRLFEATADAESSVVLTEPEVRHDRKFEVLELTKMFYNPVARRSIEIAFLLYMYCLLWSYTVMFGSSVAEIATGGKMQDDHSNSCTTWYRLSIVAFGAIVIPVTCMEVKQQTCLQTIFSMYRFSSFAAMILTAVIALFESPFEGSSAGLAPPYTNPQMKAVDWSGFSLLFSTAGVCQIMHFSFASIAEPMQNKRTVVRFFTAGFITSGLLFCSLALACSLYFGPPDHDGHHGTQQLISLNWDEYTGSDFQEVGSSELWVKILRYFITAFPAVAMLSNYPLCGLALGNNIYDVMPERWQTRWSEARVKVYTRLAASLFPLALAQFEYDLAVVFKITGLLAFVLGYLIPASLQVLTIKRCIALNMNPRTPYHTCLSSIPAACGVFGLGVGLIIYTLVSLAL